MLNKVSEESIYLNLSELDINRHYTKLALLSNFSMGRDKKGAGFYTFYVKDVNGNIVTCRLFNIEKFLDSSTLMYEMKNRPVKITFLAQQYNGSISLIVNEIGVYEGTFDYESFMGIVDDLDLHERSYQKIVSHYCENVNFYLNFRQSLSTIYSGKVGGYCAYLDMIARTLSGYKFSSVQSADLFNALNKLSSKYFDYLTMCEKTVAVNFNSKQSLYLRGEERSDLIANEVLSSLMGSDYPQRIESHILLDVMNMIKSHIQYSEMLMSMPKGLVKVWSEKTFIND